MFGVFLDEYESIKKFNKIDILYLILAPIIVPILFGISINERKSSKS